MGETPYGTAGAVSSTLPARCGQQLADTDDSVSGENAKLKSRLQNGTIMKQPNTPSGESGTAEGSTEVQREETLLKAGALQSAIFNSANFSSIATDAKGVIQIFNVGAERMLGYAAADVMNKITPADISDP